MYNKFLILLLILNIDYFYTSGQEKDMDNQNAPNTGGNTLNLNPNLYTGIISTAIPLFQIKAENIALPVMIINANNQIEANVEDAPVGFGWKLFAGGQITRLIKGLPDEDGKAKYIDLKNSPIDTIVKIDNLRSDYDGEPDVYYYQFLGQSGQFMIDGNGKAITIPYNPSIIDIKYTKEKFGDKNLINSFKIYTNDGAKYEFNEYTEDEIVSRQNSNFHNNIPSEKDNDSDKNFNNTQNYEYNKYRNNWYLTDILPVNKTDSIKIKYTTKVLTNKINLNQYEERTVNLSNGLFLEVNICDTQRIYSIQKYPFLITSNKEEISFQYFDTLLEYKGKEMTCISKTDGCFTQKVKQNDPDVCNREANKNLTYCKYEDGYVTIKICRDYPVSVLIDNILVNSYYNNSGLYACDRYLTRNPKKRNYYILKSISHRFKNFKDADTKINLNQTIFEYDYDNVRTFKLRLDSLSIQVTDIKKMYKFDYYGDVKNIPAPENVFRNPNNYYGNTGLLKTIYNFGNATITNFEYEENNYFDSVKNKTERTFGYRIKKIQTQDDITKKIFEKNYSYNDIKNNIYSSGRVFSEKYLSIYYEYDKDYGFLKNFPMGYNVTSDLNGVHVGYSYVKEEKNTETNIYTFSNYEMENFKKNEITEKDLITLKNENNFLFSNENEYFDDNYKVFHDTVIFNNFPINLKAFESNYNFWKRGLLLKKETYSIKKNKLIQIQKTEYNEKNLKNDIIFSFINLSVYENNYINDDIKKALKINVLLHEFNRNNKTYYFYLKDTYKVWVFFHQMKIQPGFMLPISTTETNYSTEDPNKSLTTTTNLEYDENFNLKSSIQIQPDGTQVKTDITYNNPNNGGIEKIMYDRGIRYVPISQKTSRKKKGENDFKEISTETKEFYLNNDKILEHKSHKDANVLNEKISASSEIIYDSEYRPISTKTKYIPPSYVSYNNQNLPISQITLKSLFNDSTKYNNYGDKIYVKNANKNMNFYEYNGLRELTSISNTKQQVIERYYTNIPEIGTKNELNILVNNERRYNKPVTFTIDESQRILPLNTEVYWEFEYLNDKNLKIIEYEKPTKDNKKIIKSFKTNGKVKYKIKTKHGNFGTDSANGELVITTPILPVPTIYKDIDFINYNRNVKFNINNLDEFENIINSNENVIFDWMFYDKDDKLITKFNKNNISSFTQKFDYEGVIYYSVTATLTDYISSQTKGYFVVSKPKIKNPTILFTPYNDENTLKHNIKYSFSIENIDDTILYPKDLNIQWTFNNKKYDNLKTVIDSFSIDPNNNDLSKDILVTLKLFNNDYYTEGYASKNFILYKPIMPNIKTIITPYTAGINQPVNFKITNTNEFPINTEFKWEFTEFGDTSVSEFSKSFIPNNNDLDRNNKTIRVKISANNNYYKTSTSEETFIVKKIYLESPIISYTPYPIIVSDTAIFKIDNKWYPDGTKFKWVLITNTDPLGTELQNDTSKKLIINPGKFINTGTKIKIISYCENYFNSEYTFSPIIIRKNLPTPIIDITPKTINTYDSVYIKLMNSYDLPMGSTITFLRGEINKQISTVFTKTNNDTIRYSFKMQNIESERIEIVINHNWFNQTILTKYIGANKEEFPEYEFYVHHLDLTYEKNGNFLFERPIKFSMKEINGSFPNGTVFIWNIKSDKPDNNSKEFNFTETAQTFVKVIPNYTGSIRVTVTASAKDYNTKSETHPYNIIKPDFPKYTVSITQNGKNAGSDLNPIFYGVKTKYNVEVKEYDGYADSTKVTWIFENSAFPTRYTNKLTFEDTANIDNTVSYYILFENRFYNINEPIKQNLVFKKPIINKPTINILDNYNSPKIIFTYLDEIKLVSTINNQYAQCPIDYKWEFTENFVQTEKINDSTIKVKLNKISLDGNASIKLKINIPNDKCYGSEYTIDKIKINKKEMDGFKIDLPKSYLVEDKYIKYKQDFMIDIIPDNAFPTDTKYDIKFDYSSINYLTKTNQTNFSQLYNLSKEGNVNIIVVIIPPNDNYNPPPQKNIDFEVIKPTLCTPKLTWQSSTGNSTTVYKNTTDFILSSNFPNVVDNCYIIPNGDNSLVKNYYINSNYLNREPTINDLNVGNNEISVTFSDKNDLYKTSATEKINIIKDECVRYKGKNCDDNGNCLEVPNAVYDCDGTPYCNNGTTYVKGQGCFYTCSFNYNLYKECSEIAGSSISHSHWNGNNWGYCETHTCLAGREKVGNYCPSIISSPEYHYQTGNNFITNTITFNKCVDYFHFYPTKNMKYVSFSIGNEHFDLTSGSKIIFYESNNQTRTCFIFCSDWVDHWDYAKMKADVGKCFAGGSYHTLIKSVTIEIEDAQGGNEGTVDGIFKYLDWADYNPYEYVPPPPDPPPVKPRNCSEYPNETACKSDTYYCVWMGNSCQAK